jgi:hypothetical protein
MSGPTTPARASLLVMPKVAMATAMASSKLLLAARGGPLVAQSEAHTQANEPAHMIAK